MPNRALLSSKDSFHEPYEESPASLAYSLLGFSWLAEKKPELQAPGTNSLVLGREWGNGSLR